MYAYRPGTLVDENANAIIVPGPEPSNRGTSVDANAFHAAHVHVQDAVLHKTAKQMDVALEVELQDCKDYSMTKYIRMPTLSKTHSRVGKTVTVKGTQRQARSVVSLRRGTTSLNQLARGSRW